MRNVFFAALIVLFAMVVAKTGDSASTNDSSVVAAEAPRGGVHCSVIANRVSPGGTPERIVASGRFRCDRPGADSIAMTVSLQRRGADGQWTAVATQRFTAAGAETTRDRNDGDRTREVTAGCTAGTYRTVITATSVSQKQQRTYRTDSRGVDDPCARR